MSHIVTLKVQMKSLGAVIAAARRMGVPEPTHLGGNSYKVPYMPGLNYPHVRLDLFENPSAEVEVPRLQIDSDYQEGFYKFQEVYTQEAVRQEAIAAGQSITETVEDGEVVWILEGAGV